MKKLGVLVALVLCVTIGGVYAAWAYTGNNVTSFDRPIAHGLEVYEQDNPLGTYHFEDNTVDLTIDQTAADDYTAYMYVTGSVTVHFTADPGAPDAVKTGGVPTKAYLDVRNLDANQYDGKNIYIPTGTEITLVWTPVEGRPGELHATITDAQIASMIQLNEGFVLNDIDKYNAFNNLLSNISINLIVSMITE